MIHVSKGHIHASSPQARWLDVSVESTLFSLGPLPPFSTLLRTCPLLPGGFSQREVPSPSAGGLGGGRSEGRVFSPQAPSRPGQGQAGPCEPLSLSGTLSCRRPASSRTLPSLHLPHAPNPTVESPLAGLPLPFLDLEALPLLHTLVITHNPLWGHYRFPASTLHETPLPPFHQKVTKSSQLYLMLCRAKLLQSCLTLYDPLDCSPPGSSVHGILQARTLEWVAMPSSRGSS